MDYWFQWKHSITTARASIMKFCHNFALQPHWLRQPSGNMLLERSTSKLWLHLNLKNILWLLQIIALMLPHLRRFMGVLVPHSILDVESLSRTEETHLFAFLIYPASWSISMRHLWKRTLSLSLMIQNQLIDVTLKTICSTLNLKTSTLTLNSSLLSFWTLPNHLGRWFHHLFCSWSDYHNFFYRSKYQSKRLLTSAAEHLRASPYLSSEKYFALSSGGTPQKTDLLHHPCRSKVFLCSFILHNCLSVQNHHPPRNQLLLFQLLRWF